MTNQKGQHCENETYSSNDHQETSEDETSEREENYKQV